MAVAFDAVGPAGGAGSASLTWTHIAASGSALLVGACIDFAIAASTCTATFNGVSMTALGKTNVASANNGYLYVFGLPNVSGSHSVVLTYTANGATAPDVTSCGSLSFTGADQVSPFGTYQHSQNTTGSQTIAGTTTSSSSILCGFNAEGNNGMTGMTAGTSKIVLNAGSSGDCGTLGGGYAAGTGSTVNLTWTPDATSSFGIGAVEVLPPGAGGSASPMLTTKNYSRVRHHHGMWRTQPQAAFFAQSVFTATAGLASAVGAALDFNQSMEVGLTPSVATAYSQAPGGQGTLIAGNLLSLNDQSLETSVGSWTTDGTNSTVAQSSAFAYDGTHSLSNTATAAGLASVWGNATTVTAGVTYQFFAAVYTTTAGLNASLDIDWYATGAVYLSSSGSGSIPLVQNTWTWVSMTVAAPATAVVGHFVPSFTATTGGQVAYFDQLFVGPPTAFPNNNIALGWTPGLSTGTGTSQTPGISLAIGLATGTGAALVAGLGLTIGLAGATGAAQAVGGGLTTGLATGAGTTPFAGVGVAIGLASGVGAANAPPGIGLTPALASGTGAAQTAQSGISSNAGLATGTGAANTPGIGLTIGLAGATGAAQAVGGGLTSGLATGAGAVQFAGTGLIPGLASGTGAANAPNLGLIPGLSTGTGAAQAPGIGLTPALATGTGTAQPVSAPASSFSFFTGVNGPGSPTSYSGPFVAGLSFLVTEGSTWFQGFNWWVPTGGDTGAQKFALWAQTSQTAGTLVPNTTITSGTLTAGAWNTITLPNPVELAIGTVYVAATGWTVVNGFPDTSFQFASGDPYSAGITAGPVFAYADGSAGGSPGNPYSCPQGLFSTAGTDPSLVFPAAGSNSANFWIDVVVSRTAPVTFNGPYQFWPSNVNMNWAATQDSAVNYSIAQVFTLSQSCAINAIRYFSPSGTAQLATECGIWSGEGLTGTLLVQNLSPSWSGAAGSGWVQANLSGTILPAGTYKVYVYNNAGTPDQWSAKDASTNYWSTGTGVNGITNGPLSAPNLSSSPLANKYTPGVGTEPGQNVFSVGPPSTVPNEYVDGLAQWYGVDILVTPATPTALAPTLQTKTYSKARHHKGMWRTQPQLVFPGVPAFTATAGLATATGAALDTTEGMSVGLTPGLATGTGAADTPTIGLNMGLATGTGAAQAVGGGITSGLATGAGTAQFAGTGLTTGLATATGAAKAPGTGLTIGLASGAGASFAPSLGITAGLATGIGAAQIPVAGQPPAGAHDFTGSTLTDTNTLGGTLSVSSDTLTGTLTVAVNNLGGTVTVAANNLGGTVTVVTLGGTLSVSSDTLTGTLTVAVNNLGGTVTVAVNNQGGTVTVVTLGGTLAVTSDTLTGTLSVAVNNLGGTVTVAANNLGGTVTVVTFDGILSVTSDTLTGTLSVAVNTLSGTVVADKMQEVDIALNEYNDVTVTFQIKNNGSPMDITGMTVNALFKKTRGDLDSAGTTTTFSSAGGSPAITINTPSTGSCTLLIPHADVLASAWTFYRIDVVNSGVITTAIYGIVTITLL